MSSSNSERSPSPPGTPSESDDESDTEDETPALLSEASDDAASSKADADSDSERDDSSEADAETESSAESTPASESSAESEKMEDSDLPAASESGTDTEASESNTAAASANKAAASESNTDTESDTDTESGNDSVAASANKAEKFEAHCFGTLEEHAKSHAYPANVATCGTCKFWKHRWEWSAEASCLNPVTQKKETWLGCKNGRAICLICAAYKGVGRREVISKGTGSFRRWRNILRHGNLLKVQTQNSTHESARQAWQERLRAEAVQSEIVSVCPAASAASVKKDEAASVTTHQPTTGHRAVIATRALLETSGSFYNYDVWVNALAGAERQALESMWHCRRLVNTMAHRERGLTHSLLSEGAVFRLQADGLDRTYQVEIGTVLWSLPSSLRQLPTHGEQPGWLQVMGPKGPWVVERLIGMQEFPGDMSCDGKVSMLEACVRRACLSASGELDTKLHQHVKEQTRVWTSDGADLQVPLAASGFFTRLKYIYWDEAHAACRLAENSMKGEEEIIMTDRLLVTSKKPQSLAKFLSMSLVFRKTVGDAQLAHELAFVRNFGWAPQRFNSRARPLKRESRRWSVIFEAVAAEADTATEPKRKALAMMFLTELSGEHSSRLLLGGLLADLSAEHYSWVATGDKANPDTTTVEERADAFLNRLHRLFTEGMILAMPDTYTGVTLEFLKDTSYYRYGKRVQTIGIGDWVNEESARNVIKVNLGYVQKVVANMIEYMRKLYRPKHSWLHAFTAFRLPSPLSGEALPLQSLMMKQICFNFPCRLWRLEPPEPAREN